MGLFHMVYERNLRALLDGLKIFEREHPSISVQVTCRCEHIRPQVLDGTKAVTVLPFASEAQVAKDMESADLLYMPLPFGEAYEKFARYSLSTKMVTYAGSGVPILYHGPATSAAYDLLHQNNAAILAHHPGAGRNRSDAFRTDPAEASGHCRERTRARGARVHAG